MVIFRINSIGIIEPLAWSKRNNDVISQMIYDDIFFNIFICLCEAILTDLSSSRAMSAWFNIMFKVILEHLHNLMCCHHAHVK